MDDEEYEKATELLKTVEYYEIQNMVHHMLQAEDLVRGAFPKVSLEVLFINLYNLVAAQGRGGDARSARA